MTIISYWIVIIKPNRIVQILYYHLWSQLIPFIFASFHCFDLPTIWVDASNSWLFSKKSFVFIWQTNIISFNNPYFFCNYMYLCKSLYHINVIEYLYKMPIDHIFYFKSNLIILIVVVAVNLEFKKRKQKNSNISYIFYQTIHIE